MDFLGIGPLELIFVLIIALIVLGPKDMVKTGRTVGSFLRKIVQSPGWRTVQQTSQELRYLPNKLMRESGLDEEAQKLQQVRKDLDMSDVRNSIAKAQAATREGVQEAGAGLSAWTTVPPGPAPDPAPAAESDSTTPA